MSKRLQVVLPDAEWRDLEHFTRARRTTISEWVRTTLRAARQQQAASDTQKRLQVIRTATKYSFPSGSIDSMLGEIAQGYDQGLDP